MPSDNYDQGIYPYMGCGKESMILVYHHLPMACWKNMWFPQACTSTVFATHNLLLPHLSRMRRINFADDR